MTAVGYTRSAQTMATMFQGLPRPRGLSRSAMQMSRIADDPNPSASTPSRSPRSTVAARVRTPAPRAHRTVRIGSTTSSGLPVLSVLRQSIPIPICVSVAQNRAVLREDSGWEPTMNDGSGMTSNPLTPTIAALDAMNSPGMVIRSRPSITNSVMPWANETAAMTPLEDAAASMSAENHMRAMTTISAQTAVSDTAKIEERAGSWRAPVGASARCR